MPVYQVSDKKTIAPLFAGWEQTMIWSCLQDCMGVAYTDDLSNPLSAQIVIKNIKKDFLNLLLLADELENMIYSL